MLWATAVSLTGPWRRVGWAQMRACWHRGPGVCVPLPGPSIQSAFCPGPLGSLVLVGLLGGGAGAGGPLGSPPLPQPSLGSSLWSSALPTGPPRPPRGPASLLACSPLPGRAAVQGRCRQAHVFHNQEEVLWQHRGMAWRGRRSQGCGEQSREPIGQGGGGSYLAQTFLPGWQVWSPRAALGPLRHTGGRTRGCP